MKKKRKREITCSIWKRLWPQNKERRWEKPQKKKREQRIEQMGVKKMVSQSHMGNKRAEL